MQRGNLIPTADTSIYTHQRSYNLILTTHNVTHISDDEGARNNSPATRNQRFTTYTNHSSLFQLTDGSGFDWTVKFHFFFYKVFAARRHMSDCEVQNVRLSSQITQHNPHPAQLPLKTFRFVEMVVYRVSDYRAFTEQLKDLQKIFSENMLRF